MSPMSHLALIDPLLMVPGDRMSRKEFLDRWTQMPDLKYAELIDGVVYMPPPLSNAHAKHEGLIAGVLVRYAAHNPDCEYLVNGTWLMTRKSAPQPDQALRKVNSGRSRVEGKLSVGVPELAAEVCLSSRSYDLGPKRQLYEAAGVPEYLAVIVGEERIEWRVLENGRYRIMKPHRDGTLRSKVFPGLWLNTGALWKGDVLALMNTVDRGVAAAKG